MGIDVGLPVGLLDGETVGLAEGRVEGWADGSAEGIEVGELGVTDGDDVGELVTGATVGLVVGDA